MKVRVHRPDDCGLLPQKSLEIARPDAQNFDVDRAWRALEKSTDLHALLNKALNSLAVGKTYTAECEYIGRLLDATPQCVDNWRKGVSLPSARFALHIIYLVDPAGVLAMFSKFTRGAK